MRIRFTRNMSVLTVQTVNQRTVTFEYAVRGAQAIRAEELKSAIATDPTSVPFKEVIACNIGNPQQLGQQPITFYRQVAALVEYPDLMRNEKASSMFPSDAIARATELLKSMGGSAGAYTHSQGIPLIRQRVAEFIEKRDGYPADPNAIFLTAGASPGVQMVMQSVIAHKDVGIMVPIPQYPLYTASIELYGGQAVSYYLNEASDWATSGQELKRAKKEMEAQCKEIDIRALCVINPGNPTGQCLSKDVMKEIIQFCYDERVVLLADEVYQANIYTKGLPFHSFKKVLREMGPKYEKVEMISFHSISKGMIGECGKRGGYFECVNIDPKVRDLFYKVASVSLCPPVQGQVLTEMMVNPPKSGDASFDLYHKEVTGIYDSLIRRSTKLAIAFNSLEGVTCNSAQGALYLFPQVTMSKKAIEAAKAAGQLPDAFYSMELLNATGVCVVPGSGFGQVKDTWHFRATFLPPENQMDAFISSIKVFHEFFVSQYK